MDITISQPINLAIAGRKNATPLITAHTSDLVGGRTGANTLEEAERYLARRVESIRQAIVYGVRQSRIFREAATKYLLENQHKRSIADDANHLKQIDKFIGHLYLEQVHSGTLQAFIESKKAEGRKSKTINLTLGSIRCILNLAATEWLDENGLTWLIAAPKIRMLPIKDARTPYPLSWEEQNRLFCKLPEHLRDMAIYKVNTGCREQEVCQLKWEWEIKVPEINTFVFLIPGIFVKNSEERLIVLNDEAKAVINRQRGKHSEYVFTYKGKPVKNMYNTAWKHARAKAGLMQVRIHDLKHTFGRRLRAAGVNLEDRQDLLGHKSGKITTHYSAAELQKLIEAANKVCSASYQGMELTLLRVKRKMLSQNTCSRKSPAKVIHL